MTDRLFNALYSIVKDCDLILKVFTKYSLSLVTIFAVGCATSLNHVPVPEEFISQATILETSNVRFWGDEESTGYRSSDDIIQWLEQRAQNKNSNNLSLPVLNVLALSGGGEDGPFAAGVITGWTRNGDRPQFDVVTGVSAGALISPFVFLGPEYDDVLFEIFANLEADHIYRPQIFSGLFGGSALYSSRPLKELIHKHVTAKILNQIAIEHRKGRRLWIGTTNLDAGRPVIWDIGALAVIQKPNKLDIFHKILLASSSVPGLFPPVLMGVTVGDKSYTELHVDGGVTRQVFFYPPQFAKSRTVKVLSDKFNAKLYIIRSGRSQALYEPIETSTYSIALRSIMMTMQNKAIGDLYRIYETAKRDGFDYNLAIIPETFDQEPKSDFDADYTNSLFYLGYELSKNGYPWIKAPPEFTPNE